jgi:uncharacterized protein
MLLISGESRYADLMERLLYNGILSSPGLDGASFFYVNPLMLRNGRYVRLSANPPEEQKSSGRPEWHKVACCPSNTMRLRASLSSYFVTSNDTGFQIHQYSNMAISFKDSQITVETEYPWDGQIKITVAESSDKPWALALRVPGWCQNFDMKINGQDSNGSLQKGYVTLERIWKAGDVLEANFTMPPFLVEADPRVDDLRGCVAIQRGPMVYCLEEHDQEPEVNLLDLMIDTGAEIISRKQTELLGSVVTLETTGYLSNRSGWQGNNLYRPVASGNKGSSSGRKLKLTAIPYYAWGNRGLKSMRVWIPRAPE